MNYAASVIWPRRLAANSVGWFAAHELRLIWRDFASLVTAGKPGRIALVGSIIVAFIAGMHWFAAHLLSPVLEAGITVDKASLVMVSGVLAMMFSLMFSQAIESVTRAYYARSDLDLLLSSPATVRRLFQVRTSVLTLQTVLLSVAIASPVINVLAVLDNPKWLLAYVVLIALGGIATAFAVLLTLFLFRSVGPVRTRLLAQIVAAIVGAGFVISLQAIAIVFGQGISRISLFQSDGFVAGAPDVTSFAWLPAKAAMGQGLPLLIVVLISAIFLIAVISHSTKRFATDAMATAGLIEKKTETREFAGFIRKTSIRAVLRRKEWALLKRDPWLMSQSLQQLLYLITPGLLLWMHYGEGDGIYYVVIPVIVMAAGQLAGGLSWITISGEDAHELIDTAPVSNRTILLAKVEAVVSVIGVVTIPFVVVLGLFSIEAALCLIFGLVMATTSAVTIQLWFRSQANRSLFRRRQVSSKAATVSEALVTILWAGAASLAYLHIALIIPFAVLAVVAMAVAFAIRPRRDA